MATRLSPRKALGTATVMEFEMGANITITEGDIVAIDATNNKTILAADAQAANTVLGVAMETKTTTTVTAANKIKVDVTPGAIWSMAYSGTAPTLFDAYDLHTAAYILDGDDITGGWIMCMGNVDTTLARCDVRLLNTIFG